MLICIQTKNEPLSACDILIAKENAQIQIPASDLKAMLQSPPDIRLVKEKENMLLKCGILITQILSELDKDAVNGPVQVLCADKPILEAVCSLDYPLSDKTEAKCVPARPDAKPSSPRAKTPAKTGERKTPARRSKTANQDAAPPTTQPGPDAQPSDENNDEKAVPDTDGRTSEPPAEPDAANPDTNNAATPVEPNDDEPIGPVAGNEVDLSGTQPEPEKPKPGEAPAAKIMNMLRDAGVPSGQLPGVLDAIRASADPDMTLPLQLKMKLTKDGAIDDMPYEDTAKRVAPLFHEIKSLMEEAQRS